MKKLLLIAFIIGCSTEPEEIVIPDADVVCEKVYSDVDGSFVSCEADCELFSDVCYHSNDLDVLRGIRAENDSLANTILLYMGVQNWNNGRLTYLSLSWNQLTSLPESIGNLSSLEYLYLWNNQLISIPESICNLPDDCHIAVSNNQLCEEYHFDCIDTVGSQSPSNCP